MNEEVVANMRERIRRVRRIIQLAHNPEMVALLEEMIEEAEADIVKLEGKKIPPPASI